MFTWFCRKPRINLSQKEGAVMVYTIPYTIISMEIQRLREECE